MRLLETFECHMIAEIRKKIDKEATLATDERVRVGSNLATDLWKRPVSSGLVDAGSDNCTASVHLSLSLPISFLFSWLFIMNFASHKYVVYLDHIWFQKGLQGENKIMSLRIKCLN